MKCDYKQVLKGVHLWWREISCLDCGGEFTNTTDAVKLQRILHVRTNTQINTGRNTCTEMITCEI